MTSDVPKSHPRYLSLKTRDQIVAGVEQGITSVHGLIAQGRGEAFDYLIGEKTQEFAIRALQASAAALLLAERPVLSINGNVAALVAKEVCEFAKLVGAQIEINIFHASIEREQAIANALYSAGASQVLLPQDDCVIEGVDHNRKRVHPEGILQADVVFVPLEDGDRCELLVSKGKRVITVDLNPQSRTSRTASITVVDNLCRIWEPLTKFVLEMQSKPRSSLQDILAHYNNPEVLEQAKTHIRSNF